MKKQFEVASKKGYSLGITDGDSEDLAEEFGCLKKMVLMKVSKDIQNSELLKKKLSQIEELTLQNT